MALVQISSDPFARTETMRATIPAAERTRECAWCGVKGAKFRYGFRGSHGPAFLSQKPFCSIDCWRTYCQ